MRLTRFGTAALLAGACLAGCGPLGQEGSSVARGDQAFAHGDLEEALAEYRLAEAQGAADAATLARIAHTYLELERIDEARAYYRRAVAQDSTLTDQAAADFAHLAREEGRNRDDFGMASAVQTALEFRPGISLEDLSLQLAEHYSAIGEHGRALPFYLKTLSVLDPETLPRILFQTAIAYDEVGDCETATLYYEDYRDRLRPWQTERGEVDWRLGNCSFQLARVRRAEGDDQEALRHLETLLRIGEPQNLLAMGYYEKGEVLGDRGECEAAIEAFERVASEDLSGSLSARAAERIDQIRFGGRGQRILDLFRTREEGASCFPPGLGTRPRRGGT